METLIPNDLLDTVRKNSFVDIDGDILVSAEARGDVTAFLKAVDLPRFVLMAANSPELVFNDIATTAVVSQCVEAVTGADLLWVASSTEEILNIALLLCRLSTVSAVLVLDSCPRLRQAAMGATKVVFLDIVGKIEPFEEFLAVHLLPHVSEWLGDGGQQTTNRLISLLTSYSPSLGLCLSTDAESVVRAKCGRLYPSLLSFEASELRARAEQALGFGKRMGWLEEEQSKCQLFLVAAIEVSESLVTFIVPLVPHRLLFAPRVAAEFEIELRSASVNYVPISDGDCLDSDDKTRHSSWKIHSKSVFRFPSVDRRSSELASSLHLSGNDVQLAGFRATRRGIGVVMARLPTMDFSGVMVDN
jgi:hypothetical protein